MKSEGKWGRRALEAVGQIAAKLPGEATRDDTPLADDLESLIAEARAIVLARAERQS